MEEVEPERKLMGRFLEWSAPTASRQSACISTLAYRHCRSHWICIAFVFDLCNIIDFKSPGVSKQTHTCVQYTYYFVQVLLPLSHAHMVIQMICSFYTSHYLLKKSSLYVSAPVVQFIFCKPQT